MYILPPKLLQIKVLSSLILTRWTEKDTTNNKWYNQPYQWTVSMTVTAQKHSCPITKTANQYNGLDINVGDWISSSVGGAVFKIINISSASATTVTADVEDVDRMSLMLDKTGRGNIKPAVGPGYCFSLNDQGQPIITGTASGYVSDTWQSDITSRFNYRNEAIQNILVNQPGHTFQPGDIISPDPKTPGSYILAPVTNELGAIGTVKDIGIPSTDDFTYKPFGKILYNITPEFTGNYGDIYYLDPNNPGKLTTSKPSNHAKPVYIQIDSSTAITLDDDISPDPVRFIPDPIVDGQTQFNLPVGAVGIVQMTINGMETDSFTYDPSTMILTFDPKKCGYGIDSTDEVAITYKV